MIQCIIVDDEPRNISVLKKMITRHCPELAVAGKAENTQEAIQLIGKIRPQLVFLDIEMGEEDAFSLLQQMPAGSFEIIFVTGFDKYAFRAFQVNAIDYLLKPVDSDALKSAVQKVGQRLAEKTHNHQPAVQTASGKFPFSKIALRTKDGLLFYSPEEIVYCSAERSYTRFHFVKGKSLLVSGHLKEFENTLPSDSFCRVHDAHLINLNQVKKYHHGKGGYVEMMDGRLVEVSLRKRADFLARLRY